MKDTLTFLAFFNIGKAKDHTIAPLNNFWKWAYLSGIFPGLQSIIIELVFLINKRLKIKTVWFTMEGKKCLTSLNCLL